MLQLPKNCRAGNIAIFPANWKTSSANMKLTWRITYWFYDDTLKRKKQIVIKGMNMASTLKEKQNLTQYAIDEELFEIQQNGFNHVTGEHVRPAGTEVSEFTPLIDALDWAFKTLDAEPDTKMDIKSCLKYLKQGIKTLCYDRLLIGQVRRKNIKILLEKTGEIKQRTLIPIGKTGRTKPGIWSSNVYNHYRKYLSVLFKQLVEIEAVDVNPVREISKKKQIKKIRETLSVEERARVSCFIKNNYYSFWRFMQIFFHSGAREIELLKVKGKDVDIMNQKYKVVVKKGKRNQEEWRTIKTIALPYWIEIMALAGNDQYLFSWGLVPGDKVNTRAQITKRWRKHVKDKLGITADLYSLKHSNLDEIAGALDLGFAQQMAGHSTPLITMTYATGEKERKHNRLKDVDNAF